MINKSNLKQIESEIDSQIIVAATKYVGVEVIQELVELGINNIGENRVEAFCEKYQVLHDLDIIWHFIGHLQSKKVKKVINYIDYLHSLDRMSLAEVIQKYRKLPLKCFIEVNIAEESSKYGLNMSDVYSFCENIKSYDKILVVGLMGMAELTEDQTKIEHQFLKLVALKDDLNKNLNMNLEYLSMGMSNDYKIAIKVGATHLRLGSILFRNEE